MAGWLDGLINSDPGGLLAFLRAASSYSPGAGALPLPRPAGRRAEEDVYPPPMPDMNYPPYGPRQPMGPELPQGPPNFQGPFQAQGPLDYQGPFQAQGPMQPPEVQGPPMPPSPFDTGAPAAPYMFGGGLPPMALPPPSPYFPQGARAADVPAAPPTSGAVAPAAQPSILGAIGRNILQGLQDNSNALIAGGGAAMTGGLGRGFQAFAAASPLDIAARREQQANQAQKSIYQALRNKGFSEVEALAGSQDKDVLKTLIEPPKVVQGSKDFLGNQPAYVFNGRTMVPVESLVPGAKPGSAANALNVSNINQNLVGEDFLKQFPPIVQSAIKDYHNSRVIPTGNPRLGTPAAIKWAAEKYGQDIGQPVDDAAFAERKKIFLDLEGTGNQSLGGQRTNANASLKHLAEAAEAAVKVANAPAILGTYPLAHGYNALKNLTAPHGENLAALKSATSRYGGESTKFLTGGPGTEAERSRFDTLLGSQGTPGEMAAVFEKERELVMDKLISTQDKLERNFGGAAAIAKNPKFQMLEPATVEKLKVLDAAIARLRQREAGGSSAQAPTPTQPPITATGPGGVQVILQGNRWVPMQ